MNAILYLPVLVYLGQEWLHNPYYGHGFLVLLVSGFIFWLRRHYLEMTKPWLPGILLLGSGLALYLFAFLFRIQSLAAFSLLIVLSGLVSYLCGRERARPFLFPILFLIFMIPAPFLNNISYHLQAITTISSAAIARLVGIPTVITGNQIEIPKASFVVGTPCSGLSSLISLLALGAIIAFVASGSFWKKGTLFVSAFPLAVLANTPRVTSILLIANGWGSEAALSFFHTFSSISLFMVAIVLLVLLAGLLRCRFGTLSELACD